MKRIMKIGAMIAAILLMAGTTTTIKAASYADIFADLFGRADRLSELNGESYIAVECNMSEAKILGFSQEAFVEFMIQRKGQQWLREWPREYTTEWEQDFRDDLGKWLGIQCRIVATTDVSKCKYKIVLDLIESDEDGERITAVVKIIHIESGRVIDSLNYNNRRMDFDSLGENVARYIARNM